MALKGLASLLGGAALLVSINGCVSEERLREGIIPKEAIGSCYEKEKEFKPTTTISVYDKRGNLVYYEEKREE